MGGAGGLLERDEELGLIGAAIAAAGQGRGWVAVAEGPAGIGKTALCGQACALARASGRATVLTAVGSPLERDYSYGVVRQLFGPVLRRAVGRGRAAEVSSAAARAAWDVVGGGCLEDHGAHAPERLYAALHGLFTLTADLAERFPLLMVVDDAHWADLPSQRYLSHVAVRLEAMPVVMLVAIRTGEPGQVPGTVADLAGMSGVTVLRPRPLSRQATALLVESALGPPDERFTGACLQATGGVPFYLRELLDWLAREGVRPTAAAAGRVARAGPDTVARAIRSRLLRLGAPAAAVARAVAVLGQHADAGRVAALAGLADDDVLTAVDQLVSAGILRGRHPLRFAHPIVRAAIYEEMPGGARDKAHRHAARLLGQEGADAEEVAAHLLATAPRSAGDIRDRLRAAAARAIARGAPESAVAYLRRLLDESRACQDRAGVLHELGRAEALMRDPRAAEHLRAAHAEARDARTRASIACDLADVLGSTGCWEARIPLLRSAIGELADGCPEVRLQLERRQAGLEAYDSRFVADFDRRAADRRRMIGEGHPGARPLALLFAAVAAWRGGGRGEVACLVRRGLDSGRFLADAGPADPSLAQAVGALLLVEEHEQARELVGEMLRDAGRRGSARGRLQALACRAWLATQAGDLAAAEADLRVAAEAAREGGDMLALVSVLRFGLDALAERPGLADLAAAVEEITLRPGWQSTLTEAFLLEMRGQLRSLAGSLAGAAADLRAAGTIYDALNVTNPVLVSWRSSLARALPASSRAQARALVAAELRLAEAAGWPRARSRALRVAGLIEGGKAGIGSLQRAVAHARRCPSPLEEARSQVELGAALRRARQPVSARAPLAAGLQLADRCGAQQLAARALAELRMAGARPRRRAVQGPGALTAAEERVARLAGQGLTNAGIAQALCVSVKTVENHLGSAYRKLQIRARGELPGALAGAPREAGPGTCPAGPAHALR